jgi:hypothetical protein
MWPTVMPFIASAGADVAHCDVAHWRRWQAQLLYPEMVFILGRMGNAKQALKLIIDKLGDVAQANRACGVFIAHLCRVHAAFTARYRRANDA